MSRHNKRHPTLEMTSRTRLYINIRESMEKSAYVDSNEYGHCLEKHGYI